MKNLNEMKRNELIEELKKNEIQFDIKMKNSEMIQLLNENSKNESEDENLNQKSFFELIQDEEIKKSNFQFIHEKYMNEKEISFNDSLELKFDNQSLKEFMNEERIKSFNDNFEFIMIHRESRKIYYLFLYDIQNKKEYFIMKNDSIMKNKIYLLKFSQFFEIDNILIHYIKNDRKNQSREIIDRNNSEYQKKLIKYSMI